MEKRFLTHSKDPLYHDFRTIYGTSFPLHEQRTEEQQEKAFANPYYHLEITTENSRLITFISYWEFDKYIYIEHLAVNPECRGQNIGSILLQEFTASHEKTVLLEIDPLTDEISRRRLEFYKRNGFTANPYPHFHPAYRGEFPPHELIVLSYGQPLDETVYHQFNKELQEIVMA